MLVTWPTRAHFALRVEALRRRPGDQFADGRMCQTTGSNVAEQAPTPGLPWKRRIGCGKVCLFGQLGSVLGLSAWPQHLPSWSLPTLYARRKQSLE
jgi:hypothetical protein